MRTSIPLVLATALLLAASPAVQATDSEDNGLIDPMGASFFMGKPIGNEGEPGEESPGQGYTDLLGAVGRTQIEADDARISGAYTTVGNIRLADDIGVVVGTVRIDNDQGAWVGTNTTYGGPAGHEEWYVLAGEGAYEGLTAVFRYRSADDSYEGVIVPFELPALPEPVAAPTD